MTAVRIHLPGLPGRAGKHASSDIFQDLKTSALQKSNKCIKLIECKLYLAEFMENLSKTIQENVQQNLKHIKLLNSLSNLSFIKVQLK